MKPMGVCEVVFMRCHWLKRPTPVKQEKGAKTRKLIVQMPQNIFSAPMKKKNLRHPFVVFETDYSIGDCAHCFGDLLENHSYAPGLKFRPRFKYRTSSYQVNLLYMSTFMFGRLNQSH